MSGSGRPPPPDYDLADFALHRRAQLAAILSKAHHDDEERAAVERELRELDEAIARGVATLPEERKGRLAELYALAREKRGEQGA